MKLILLQHLSGANGAKAPGDEIEVTDNQAIAFLEKGIAKCKSKKVEREFLDKVESIKATQLQKEQEASAILYKDELEAKKDELETQLSEINLTLGIKEVVVSEEEYLRLIGQSKGKED